MINKHHQDLEHIRQMMERSSKFLSLSGLSGIVAGISALIGGSYAYYIIKLHDINYLSNQYKVYPFDLVIELLCVAFLVLITAIGLGMFFTIKNLKKNQLPLLTTTSKKLAWAMVIPLVAGGFFSLSLIFNGFFGFVAPTTLIFYGLALINAEKYTYSDIKYLGYIELVLGIISSFFLGQGLIFWMLGFGFFHVLYGIILFKKYQ